MPKQNSKTEKAAKKPITSRHFNLIIAIVGAVVLWMYVIGGVNPEITSSGKEVSIQLQNIEALQDRKLSLIEEEGAEYNVTVWLKGKKSAVDSVALSQIRATADLSDIKSGVNLVKINVTAPSGVTVERVFPENLDIRAEEIIETQKAVHIFYQGEGPVNTEADVLSFEPSDVVIEGPKSVIAKVKEIRAAVDLGQIQSDRSADIPLSPVDAEGAAVPNIQMERDTVQADIALFAVKDTPFDVVLTGSALTDTAVTVSKRPQTIKIKGYPGKVAQIERIASRPVDQALVTQSMELAVMPDLPEGVYLARSSPELKASFLVGKLVETTLVYRAQDIAVQGLAGGLSCDLGEAEIRVTVKSGEADADNVSRENILLTVNVEGLAEGEHTVVPVYSANESWQVRLDPPGILCRISKK